MNMNTSLPAVEIFARSATCEYELLTTVYEVNIAAIITTEINIPIKISIKVTPEIEVKLFFI